MQAQDDRPQIAPVPDNMTEYEVTVHTADVQGAGTDADVALVMSGASGREAVLTTQLNHPAVLSMHMCMLSTGG